MKKILLFIAVLFYASVTYSQDGNPTLQRSSHVTQEGGFGMQEGGKPQSRYEQVKSAKIAFFTTELELTPKEATEFWPVYNKFWKEREVAHRRIQSNLKNIGKALSGETKVSDADLKLMIENYVAGYNDDGVIQRNYLEEFYKILPVTKIAKLYKAEEDFRIRMIHQLRKGGGPGNR